MTATSNAAAGRPWNNGPNATDAIAGDEAMLFDDLQPFRTTFPDARGEPPAVAQAPRRIARARPATIRHDRLERLFAEDYAASLAGGMGPLLLQGRPGDPAGMTVRSALCIGIRTESGYGLDIEIDIDVALAAPAPGADRAGRGGTATAGPAPVAGAGYRISAVAVREPARAGGPVFVHRADVALSGAPLATLVDVTPRPGRARR
jgi:hypothetical protein